MSDKPKKTILLIQSSPVNTIGRFQVKASIFDNGHDEMSIMLVISDLLCENFKIKFFKTADHASYFINLLKAVD